MVGGFVISYISVKHVHIPSEPNSKNRVGTPGAHTLPDEWRPKTKTLEVLAKELGVSPEQVTAKYVAPFIDKATRKGFMYRNWDIGFRNSVRKDWPSARVGETA